jgi:hypothetical protein
VVGLFLPARSTLLAQVRKGHMKITERIAFNRANFAMVVLVAWVLGSTTSAAAQQGQDAVYNNSATIVASTSFIDASMFGLATTNICAVLHGILVSSSYPPAGAVIDARGLPGTTGTSMTCTASPWNGITSPPPATILLPATSGATPTPIIISTPWIIPSNPGVGFLP